MDDLTQHIARILGASWAGGIDPAAAQAVAGDRVGLRYDRTVARVRRTRAAGPRP